MRSFNICLKCWTQQALHAFCPLYLTGCLRLPIKFHLKYHHNDSFIVLSKTNYFYLLVYYLLFYWNIIFREGTLNCPTPWSTKLLTMETDMSTGCTTNICEVNACKAFSKTYLYFSCFFVCGLPQTCLKPSPFAHSATPVDWISTGVAEWFLSSTWALSHLDCYSDG